MRGVRNLELSLLLLGTMITVVAYFSLNAGETAEISAGIGIFFAIVLVLLLAAHVVVRYTAPNADGLLLPLAALLNGLGYVVIARLDENLADSQSAWTFIGIGAFSATLLLVPDLKWVANYRYTLALGGVVLLMLPLIPGLGVNINGAQIWLRVGPFSIQPGEFAKVVLAAFLAGYLVDKRDLLAISNRSIGPLHLPAFKYFGPLLLAWSVALMVMVLQRDLGSSLLFFTLFIVMIYVATGRAAYVITGAVLFSMGAFVSWRLFSHVQTRVDIWIDPFEDPKGRGFQIV
ncbi:MAG: FtsW/RodA/SpoVE family cell cycle protein, partial [Actinomycetota bacterium]